jgi:hypothetical protein
MKPFLSALTRTIEAAPASYRRDLLTALDHSRLAGDRVSNIELVEAIEVALAEEVARKSGEI